MMIIINPSHSVKVSESSNSVIRDSLTDTFRRFGNSITRIDAFLSDENGHRLGVDDKRCLLEARIAHREPIAVSAHAKNLYAAIEAATDKLEAALDRAIGKIASQAKSA